MGVYHLPKKSENFGWDVNGRLFWFARPENFRNKRNVFRCSPKFPTGISERKMCVPFAFSTSSRPFGLYSSRWRCPWKWNTHIPWKFRGFGASHLLPLSTNRFFRLNGKQPISHFRRKLHNDKNVFETKSFVLKKSFVVLTMVNNRRLFFQYPINEKILKVVT